MKVSTKGTYALKIMTDIAAYEAEKPVTIALLADSTKISEKYLEKIVNKLLKAKLLVSFRGANGGYRLAKPASNISIGEILNATEGSMKSVSCVDGSTCDHYEKCLTANVWIALNKIVDDFLSSVSLDDVINKRININQNGNVK